MLTAGTSVGFLEVTANVARERCGALFALRAVCTGTTLPRAATAIEVRGGLSRNGSG